MERELRKIVELNLLPQTGTKKDRLDTLYSAWQSACSTLFDAIEYWDGFTDKPLTSVNLHHLTYKGMREDTGLPAQVLECARREVFARRKQNRTTNIPLRYDNRTMRFGSTAKRNPILAVTVMEKGRMALPIKQDGAYKRFMDYRTEGWAFNSVLLMKRDKSYVIQIVFNKTITLKEPKEFKTIVAVDIGSTNLATVVVYNPAKDRVIRSFYLGRDVAPRQRIFEQRRSRLQSNGRIRELRNDQSNFTKTRVHQVAHQVLDIAKEHDGCIAVEDLDGFTDIHYAVKANRKIHRIPTRLGEAIGRVGIENGVPMLVVNPAHTSQDCPKCGNRHKVSGKVYRCPKCGWTVNRDRNAGENIAIRATRHVLEQDMVHGQKPSSRMAVAPSVRSNDGCVVTVSQAYRPPEECLAPDGLSRGFCPKANR